MGFLDKLFRKQEKKGFFQQSYGYSDPFLVNSFLGSQRITPYQAFRFYQNSSVVADAVDRIATEVEQIQPVIRDDNGKYVSDHDILDLIKTPNPMESQQKFIGAITRNWLLTHDVPIFLAGDTSRKPLEIWAVKPQNISASRSSSSDPYPSTIIVGSGVGIGAYVRQNTPNGWRFYDGRLRELIRICGYSSGHDDLNPDSPLQSAALEVDQMLKGISHNISLLDNGGRLSLIVNINEELTPDQMKEASHRIKEQISGYNNAGGIAITNSSQMTISEVGNSNKDMDFLNLNEISRRAIYNRYKIPLPFISQDASTFNNMESAVYHLYDMAVLPTFQRLMDELSRYIFPRFGLDLSGFRLTYNPESISALKTRTLEELKTRVSLNLETRNELRSMLPNREPVEGGDVIYQSATLIPAGTDLYTEDNTTTEEEESRT